MKFKNLSTNTLLVCHIADLRINNHPPLKLSDFLFNKYGRDVVLHCDDGPALSSCGREVWYHYGKVHRIDGPAVIDLNLSTEEYYLYGQKIESAELFIKMVKLIGFL